MKKKYLAPLLCAAVLCAVCLLWLSPSRTGLLDNDIPLSDDSASRFPTTDMDIPDLDVPLSDVPNPDGGEEDPFAQFSEEQLAYLNEVLDLVNAARKDAGLEPMTLDPVLCAAAQVRAKECVGTFSHTRPNGTKYSTAIAEAGINANYTGENAATGHTSAKQVVASWLKSEGHRANILNARFTSLGVGLEPNVGNRYKGFAWVQLFVDDSTRA